MSLPYMSLFDLVAEFNLKFELPLNNLLTPAHPLNEEDFNFRFRFLMEEMTELTDAQEVGDMEEMADALVDIVYVALGTAHMMNINFDECFMEVHKANLRKVAIEGLDDPRSTRRHRLNVVKPDGWVPPKLGKLLGLFKGGDTLK